MKHGQPAFFRRLAAHTPPAETDLERARRLRPVVSEPGRPPCCKAVCHFAQFRGDSHACPSGYCAREGQALEAPAHDDNIEGSIHAEG